MILILSPEPEPPDLEANLPHPLVVIAMSPNPCYSTIVRLSQLSAFAIVYTTLIMKIDIQEWVWKKCINQHKLQTNLS